MLARFMFWGSGADFSLLVFDHLCRLDYQPDGIVVPDYPGSTPNSAKSLPVFHSINQNRLIKLSHELSIPVVYKPESEEGRCVDRLSDIEFDFMLVACWPYRISRQVYRKAKKAAMNVHPSLLPAYRGADPVQAQIDKNETRLGVSLHLLSDEFDAGDIVASRVLKQGTPLERKEIESQAACLAAQMFVEACQKFGGPDWQPLPQK